MDAMILVQMIQTILTITVISFFGTFLALFSYFLDFCFWRHNVFAFWLPFLAKINLKYTNKAKYEYINKMKVKDDRQTMFIEAANSLPIFKMLGGCAICFNIWIGFVTYPVIYGFLGISFWYMPVYLLFSSFILRKIMQVD